MDPLKKAQMEFTPIPVAERKSPARVRSIQARLYIDRYLEHEQAFDFLTEAQSRHGEGTKLPVRALLHYRDTIVEPVEKLRKQNKDIPEEMEIALREFIPQDSRNTDRVKTVSARLRIDLYNEHREAYQFLQEMQTLHGEGNKTIVKSLLHYQQTVYEPLLQQQEKLRSKQGG